MPVESEKKEVVADNEKPQTGPSAAGFHFYNLHQCCPFKFYLRNVRGVEPVSTPEALIRGIAVHAGLEAFYKDGDLQHALEVTRDNVDTRFEQFESDDDYENARRVAHAMVESWALSYGEQDLYAYEEFMLEQELSLDLGNGHRVTVRIDRLGRLPDGTWDLGDYKTSTFSKNLTESAFRLSDQPTLYIAAAQQVLGIDVNAAYCDIAYFHKRAKKPEPYRSLPITKSALEISQTLEAIADEFEVISNKVDQVMAHEKPAHVAFKRNTYYCMSYNKPCEFAAICRDRNAIDDDIRMNVPGSELKQGKKLKALGSYTTDEIGLDK